MSEFRVIVCGGRNYSWRKHVYAEIGRVWRAVDPADLVVVHGGCPTGVDQFAHCLVDGLSASFGMREEVFPADWEKHGRAAGPMRNEAMAKAGANLCLVFPGGRGTASMKRMAEKYGIEVREAQR